MPHKSGNHQRYLPEKTKNAPIFPPDVDLEESNSEAGALQPVSEPKQPEWEGFGEEDEANGSEEEEQEEEESDDDSIQIQLETEQEKPILPKDAEEEELERMIFGDSAGFKQGLEDFSLKRTAGAYGDVSDEDQDDDEDLEGVADQDLFFFDAGPVAAPAGSAPISKAEETEDEDDKPAWDDSDDERLVVSLASVPQLRKLRETLDDDMVNGKEYSRRLRRQYERLYPTPDWAMHATGKANKKRRRTMDDDESGAESASDMDMDDEDLSSQPLAKLLKDADILSRNARGPAKKRKLQAGTVDIAATEGCHEISTYSRIFLSARRRYFHVWNIAMAGKVEKVSRIYGHQHEQRTMEHFSLSPNGKYMALKGSSRKGGGVINILDASTMQWVTQARIESRGGVADFAWWQNGQGLAIAGKNGEVTEWSVDNGVVGRWTDEGAVGTTVIALGGKSGRDNWIGGDRWVAVGSSSGVVNIYDRRAWREAVVDDNASDANSGIPKAPKPVRALGNLTTPTSHLTFSPDGQVLAMASRWKNGAMRLVHLPSATVFKNWPTEKTPLGRITSVAWGRPSEDEEREGSFALLAVGSEAGHVKMWEVRA
ncbi:hypothetical protein SNOG_02652 [Parastagonospora nodorum SN15]|uniref:WD40 repeat-like protein n=1 Tax=Phaeosphaeria nodorum (strain SN15 / ATCC MYA-4574 / FGSC 10173) TaxID=321614 RepID=Q0V012_PHANO|nr:hypothetical protein SNOG_02652 [Parastagonospora nodorum SN15]EAT89383.2 hypothetical protein SNOG_02652 [Parastagonospora nodorum SN15]